MKQTVLNDIQLEQMPTNFGRIHETNSKKSWATLIIFLVLILFGTYWLMEQKNIPSPALPIATQYKRPETSDISSIETALAQTVVPDLSTLF